MDYKDLKIRFPKHLQSDVVILCLNALINFYFVSFVERLENMSEERGFGGDSYGFCFPNIFEPYEKNEEGYFEEGVFFYFGNSEDTISTQEFHEYMKIACEIYLENKPEDKEIVNFYLDKIISNK